jgi:hypothetical protein
MMTNTPNYNLYKPNRADTVEVDTSLSNNFTIIDTEIKNRKDELEAYKATFPNKAVLESLSDSSGVLQYNGQPIQNGGSGSLVFTTLAELQAAYPDGTDQPAWVTEENSWYYWTDIIDTTAPVLTITPAATFTDTQTVTMSTNEIATIFYTLDDSDPKISGTKLTYTTPLTLTETDTIKAYAKDTAGNESAVQTVTYTKQIAKQVVTSGLKTWFDALGMSGNTPTWTDKSTNANNATLNGFQFDSTDGWKPDGSLKGDGTDDYAKTASNLGITGANARTFQFKAKVNATDNKALMGIGGTTATTYMDILVYTGNICVYNGSATSIATIPFPVTVGDIIDVAVVYDGATVKIYKNGVLLTGSYSVSYATTDSPLTLLSGAGTSFKYSSNQLYYVAVYNRALSGSEIQANYDAYK